MSRVAIIGCGVVGAAIAYELSHHPGLEVMVFDQGEPAQQATGAALGVLMGAISQRGRGRSLKMRLDSIQIYEQWVPILEAITGQSIWYNRQGILRLCFEHENFDDWQSLAMIRQQQGWELQLYDLVHLQRQYPYLNLERITGAVYSPQDRQIDATALTLALVSATQRQGGRVYHHTAVTNIQLASQTGCYQVMAAETIWKVDWVIIAAGLGSTSLTTALHHPIDIRPVLGQALQVELATGLSCSALEPVITGEDTHIVPIGNNNYWVGATVEMPDGEMPIQMVPDPLVLQTVWDQAISFCPSLKAAAIQRTWQGLRPRPEGRPAPIVERLNEHSRVLIATGHYRNGVLLAPATAKLIGQMVQMGDVI